MQAYLKIARDFANALCWHNQSTSRGRDTQKITNLLGDLSFYHEYVKKFIDQIERRLLEGEQIPASEKTFSIFEEHTEWISKGKFNKGVELGHLLCITTDQNQFIVDYKIMENEKDSPQVKSLTERLLKNYPDRKIHSHSF